MKNFKNIYTPFSYCVLTKLKRFYLYKELIVVTATATCLAYNIIYCLDC